MAATSWTMAVCTFQLFVVVVLAGSFIDELGITRWQVGMLGAVNTGAGAVAAPWLGRLTDRLGSRRSMVALSVGSAIGFLGTAAAVNYWWLIAASAVSGLPQGAGNPVTNKVIADEVPPEHQSMVTGVKQSGVQIAVFASGITLPAAAATIGWRWALVLLAALTLASAAVFHARFPPLEPADPVGPVGPVDPGSAVGLGRAGAGSDGQSRGTDPLPAFVFRIMAYACLLGISAGGVTRFYPLFAQEVLGYSEARAGLAVSLSGLLAIGARLLWARAVPRIPLGAALVTMAIGGAIAAWMLVVTEFVGAWLLWPVVVMIAFTTAAWNVVAMLALIWSVPARLSGRATGVMMMGFLGGLTLSAPLAGLAIDQTASYQPTWIALGLLALAGAAALGRSVPSPSTGSPLSRAGSSAQLVPADLAQRGSGQRRP